MILGPVLGGAAVDLASWRWSFGINVLPITAGLLLLARLGRRDGHRASATIDFPGAVLCALGLGGGAFALIEAPRLGWGGPAIVATAAVGVVSGTAFLIREARTRQPMMPLGLFRARNFAWGNAATLLVYAGVALVSFLSGIYLQEGAGLSATAAGLALLPVALVMALLSARVGALAGRLGPRLFMTVGPLVMAAGVLLLLLVRTDFAYWTQVLPGVVVIGVGLALTVSPLTSAVLGAIETSRSGIASAINNAVARIAGLIAIALIGTIVGGTLDLPGFDRALVFTAALLALGGLVSFVGIRNARAADAAE
jgi:MFS family permease